MPHDQGAVEQTKRDCRDDEQTHRRNTVGMIIEKCIPALGRRPSTPGHILGHARLSDIDAELEKLTVDARRSPQRVGNAHRADKLAYLLRYGWSATTMSRLPAPIRSETRAMPTDDCIRLDDRQRIANARKKPTEANKNQSVEGAEGLFLRSGSPQNVYLLPQPQNFRLERCPRPKQIYDRPNNEPDKISHPATASPDSRSTASQIEFATGTGGVKHPHDMPPSRFPTSPTLGDSSTPRRPTAFIPSITASECLCSSGPEFQSKKVDEAADRGGQPAARGKNRMPNSAWQRPIREDDFQCAGRDLIHDKVVCELRNANAVFGRLPQRIHVISGVSRL